jgi:FAD dependent oxidoreductase
MSASTSVATLVTRVPCPPEVALKVLEGLMLADKVQLTRTRPVAAEVDGDRVRSVTVDLAETRERTVLHGAYFLDATEGGELLAPTGTEYVSGRESIEETGEPHAARARDPLDMQAITWCFALDYV